jgi:hypothetical protein
MLNKKFSNFARIIILCLATLSCCSKSFAENYFYEKIDNNPVLSVSYREAIYASPFTAGIVSYTYFSKSSKTPARINYELDQKFPEDKKRKVKFNRKLSSSEDISFQNALNKSGILKENFRIKTYTVYDAGPDTLLISYHHNAKTSMNNSTQKTQKRYVGTGVDDVTKGYTSKHRAFITFMIDFIGEHGR